VVVVVVVLVIVVVVAIALSDAPPQQPSYLAQLQTQ
jgi:hypothetical protein